MQPASALLPLGQLLLQRGVLTRDELARGLIAHRAERVRLGEALVSTGAATQDEVWQGLAEQRGIELIDLEHHWVDPGLANEVVAADAIARQLLPLRVGGGAAIVATVDPQDSSALDYAAELLGMRVVPLMVSPSVLRRRQEAVYRQQLTQHSSGLLQAFAPQSSAHITLTLAQKRWLLIAGVVAVLLLILMRSTFFIAVAGAIITLYAAVVLFRGFVTIRGARSIDLIKVPREEVDALTEFPVYTILCPLYREAGVLPQLLKACGDLEYPRGKLDIKLLLEEDDEETLAVVREAHLPPYFDIVVVPADGPRTKPKACNYGLQFARGEYCVIYDAEDIPAPDQLKQVLAVYKRSALDIGCVQAKLNYYNPRQNLMTKWFSLEYTAWFDFFLPGLMDLGLPIPLGGSSNHFPTHLLRSLGAWDPNNVTEDADLGMRLHRAGYQTLLLDSETLEEANSDFVNWMRQRSRWGKGYFITWLVAMRQPRGLAHDVGWRSLAAIQLTLGGTFGVALLNLLAWMLLLLWILAQFDFIAYLFPNGIYYIGMIELIFGNFFFLYLGIWSASHRRTYDLLHASLLTPVYWLMASLAMLKACIQLATRPTFWEKTVHGLFETTVPELPQPPLAAPAIVAGSEAGD